MHNDKDNLNIPPGSDFNKTSFRNWLERNEIYFKTITAFLLSVMAIIISIVQIGIGIKQSEIAETQMILNSDPVIVLEPSAWIEGKDGIFNLNIKNIGLSDIYDIEVYENLFTSPFTLNTANAFSIDVAHTLPTHKYPELQKNIANLFVTGLPTLSTNKQAERF